MWFLLNYSYAGGLSVDTAFMYMIGCLCMLKIYQTRHPDVNAHAHTAYCFIAFIVFMGVMGVVRTFLLYFCSNH